MIGKMWLPSAGCIQVGPARKLSALVSIGSSWWFGLGVERTSSPVRSWALRVFLGPRHLWLCVSRRAK